MPPTLALLILPHYIKYALLLKRTNSSNRKLSGVCVSNLAGTFLFPLLNKGCFCLSY